MISSPVIRQEALVADIVCRGHELGNYLTRDEPSIRMSSVEFEAALLEGGLAAVAIRPGSLGATGRRLV